RTLSNIVWSCLATIFACTWVAIHCNIPPPHQSWFRKLGRRLKTTIVAIIAPELVVFWATKQWLTSRTLAEEYAIDRVIESRSWTQTHGFFAIMGGFSVSRVSELLHPMASCGGLAPTSRPDEFDIAMLPFPDITEEEINDKSKGDWLSKGFAILQTSWFIFQCIARRAQHLPLTELELATCAFAALNAVIYAFWWRKPQSVACPYAIGRRQRANLGYPDDGCDAGCSSLNDSYISPQSAVVPNPWCKDVAISLSCSLTAVCNYMSFGVTGPVATFVQVLAPDDIAEDRVYVDEYYAGELADSDVVILSLVLAACSAVFGAIHCIAWSLEFPSRAEQVLWRTCALGITCIPLLEFPTVWILPGILDKHGIVTFYLTALFGVIGILIYGLARIILLVLSFLCLRSLPVGAFKAVSWMNFVPHI
ncbi:hypothetical protein GLOTRDRAFT_24610, partial [Gloeophyllum trabeum ATCC 11539]